MTGTCEAAGALVFLAVLLSDEYRLNRDGLLFSVGGTGILGISRACYQIGAAWKVAKQPSASTFEIWKAFLCISIPTSTVVAGLACLYFEEQQDTAHDLWDCDSIILASSVLCGAIALVIGGSLFCMPSLPPDELDGPLKDVNASYGYAPIFTMISKTLLLLFCSPFVELSFISYVQSLSYVSAILCCFGRKIIDYATFAKSDSRVRGYHTQASPAPFLSVLVFLGIFTVPVFIWYREAPSSLGLSKYNTGPAHIDKTLPAQNAFDIVVSHYSEDIDNLNRLIAEIVSIPAIAVLNPRLIIYTKNPHADLDLIESNTYAKSVTRLANTGREGATYLHHIITSWDSLATHTMFIQASVHSAREFSTRIHDFFVPNTGMLSLGFSASCVTTGCRDRWGWYDDWDLVPEITAQVSAFRSETLNATEAPEENVIASSIVSDLPEKTLLTYKGQFIASAARIRGIDQSIYKYLLDGLTRSDSWAQTGWQVEKERLINGAVNTLERPFAGYAVERLWGVLLQCSSDDIAWRCPTLLSGRRRGGDVGDCGCLD